MNRTRLSFWMGLWIPYISVCILFSYFFYFKDSNIDSLGVLLLTPLISIFGITMGFTSVIINLILNRLPPWLIKRILLGELFTTLWIFYLVPIITYIFLKLGVLPVLYEGFSFLSFFLITSIFLFVYIVPYTYLLSLKLQPEQILNETKSEWHRAINIINQDEKKGITAIKKVCLTFLSLIKNYDDELTLNEVIELLRGLSENNKIASIVIEELSKPLISVLIMNNRIYVIYDIINIYIDRVEEFMDKGVEGTIISLFLVHVKDICETVYRSPQVEGSTKEMIKKHTCKHLSDLLHRISEKKMQEEYTMIKILLSELCQYSNMH